MCLKCSDILNTKKRLEAEAQSLVQVEAADSGQRPFS